MTLPWTPRERFGLGVWLVAGAVFAAPEIWASADSDLLFTTEAPMGNAAVVTLEEKFALAQRTICFRLFGNLDPEFVALQILSPPFQRLLDATSTGLTAKGIKAAKLKRLPFAAPPLGEQKRIVGKVRELLEILDQMELALAATSRRRQALLDATLREALVSADVLPAAA